MIPMRTGMTYGMDTCIETNEVIAFKFGMEAEALVYSRILYLAYVT